MTYPSLLAFSHLRAQVLIHMVEHEQKYLSLLERAWAAAIVKPRTISRRGGGGGGAKRKRRWTEQSRVRFSVYDGVSAIRVRSHRVG